MPEDKVPMEVVTEESVQLSQVSEMGGFNELGEYECKLARLDPTTSKKGDPMLNAYFDIVAGSHEGEEIRFNFWLGARKDAKTGRIFAPGIAEIRSSCAAVGQPLGDIAFPRDATKAGRIFGTVFLNKRVKVRIFPDNDRKDAEGNKVDGATKSKIMGLATGAVAGATAAAPAASNPLAGIV